MNTEDTKGRVKLVGCGEYEMDVWVSPVGKYKTGGIAITNEKTVKQCRGGI